LEVAIDAVAELVPDLGIVPSVDIFPLVGVGDESGIFFVVDEAVAVLGPASSVVLPFVVGDGEVRLSDVPPVAIDVGVGNIPGTGKGLGDPVCVGLAIQGLELVDGLDVVVAAVGLPVVGRGNAVDPAGNEAAFSVTFCGAAAIWLFDLSCVDGETFTVGFAAFEASMFGCSAAAFSSAIAAGAADPTSFWSAL
jgi:hypothetical protein